jgi:putative oxidoreductase
MACLAAGTTPANISMRQAIPQATKPTQLAASGGTTSMNDGFTDLALTLLRVVTGLTIAAHGYSKIFLGGRLAGTARWFDNIGMRPGPLHAMMAAGTEVGAGLLLGLGLLTPLAGAAVVALMFVAAWTVHRTNGFFIVGNGWEYNLLLAVAAVTTAAARPTRASLDHALGIEFGGTPGLVIAAAGGVVAGMLHLAVFYRPPAPASS